MRFLVLIVLISWPFTSYAMPTDGPILPEKGKWKLGAETNFLFEKQMKRPKGDASSQQYFTTLSYAPVDWFSFDFRAGCGNVKFEQSGGDTINYNTAFAGGYGFRVRLTEQDKSFLDILYAFQHISIHPDPRKVNGIKNELCLDDWQTSLILAKRFKFLYPYTAIKYSKVTLNRITSETKGTKMAGSVDRIGFAMGMDFLFSENMTAGIEGRFFDEQGLSANVSWRF